MKHFVSCGFLIKSGEKFLLCHPSDLRTGKLAGDTGWGLPKGKMDDDETFLECALRETKEETNLDLIELSKKYNIAVSAKPIFNTNYLTYFQGEQVSKSIHIFYANEPTGNLCDEETNCPVLIENTNIPEMDAYRWVSISEARKICTKSLKDLFENVQDYLP